MRNGWIGAGAVSGAVAVALGAFGAHGLEGKVSEEALAWWHTAVLYHALHTLALVAWGLFRERRPVGSVPGWSFVIGVTVFSGTLYAMTLGAPRWFGAITPIGGTALIVGWIAFAVQALRR